MKCKEHVMILFALLTTLPALSAEPCVSPAFERFGRAESETRIGAQRVLFSDLQCAACHAANKDQALWIPSKSAPLLSDVGKRLNPEWLQRFLAAPGDVSPGTTMPDMLSGIPQSERIVAAEAITHYLFSLSAPVYRPTHPDKAAVARGEGLYHRVGCVACHAPFKDAVQKTTAGVTPFPELSAKWSFDGLRRFLLNPLAVRPSGRMPAMNLSDSEAGDLAHYLLRETKVSGVLECALYRGRMRTLDDLENADLIRTGLTDGVSLDMAGRDRSYALRFTGFLRIETAGEHTFHLASEGPSRLSIDGQLVAGDAGDRDKKSFTAKGSRQLDAGWHALTLDYLQRGQNSALKVEWENAGLARAAIPVTHLRSTRDLIPGPTPFSVDAAKAAKGRALFSELRCDACHSPGANSKIQSAPPLAALQAARGCLADPPTPRAASYSLDAGQRESLNATLAQLNRADIAAPNAKEQLAHTLLSMNCYACHSRGRIGGARVDVNEFFTANVEDVGDEGRLPPRLDGVGDKLKLPWLEQVLTRGGAVRPYFNTRMPQFGAANLGHPPALFVEIDRKAQALANVSDTSEVQKEAGHKLAGTDGMSCIACHKFNRMPAHAMQIIDLLTAPERLNEDWFRQFLRDPNRFHPGTRMPSFWPDGVSVLPTVLDGNAERQIAALWTFLSDGPRAKFPAGLSRQSMELVVGGEAVVFRGKMWEAGFRALAVGFPESVNAAFDAEELRLSLLWRGKFLDASPHWSVQGMGQIRPRGTDVITFPHGSALAVLTDVKTPWPISTERAAGLKFSGYSIDSMKRPTLFYSFRNVAVEDFMTGIDTAGKASIRRTLKFSGAPLEGLNFRVAQGLVTASGENAWRLDGKLTIRASGAFLRGDGDSRELLVPVRIEGGRAKLEIEYAW